MHQIICKFSCYETVRLEALRAVATNTLAAALEFVKKTRFFDIPPLHGGVRHVENMHNLVLRFRSAAKIAV